MGKKVVHFRTNVLLKNIIGQDLINNDNIAILELVKNSFDAGSKIVNVFFKNLKNNDDDSLNPINPSKIIIQDFGNGMNELDVTEKWLNIAYSDKKNKKEEYGRLLAGAKGIGRFSCDRLGKFLNIYTTTTGLEFTHLSIDWTSFEIENEIDLEIQKIPIFVEKILKDQFKIISGYDPFAKGTIIEISRLRSKWTFLQKEKIKGKNKFEERWNLDALVSLRKYLERLINPNQAFGEENRFEIKIIANEFIEEDAENTKNQRNDLVLNGAINNKIFTELNFKTTSIESYIDYSEIGLKLLVTVLKDKGREIYKLTEDISKNAEFSLLDNSHIIIYFLNTYAKVYFTKQTGQRSVEFGSIFLFKNGFRISPYGDQGDDWLGLEVRKGQGQRRFLGTRDIVGRIEIRDTNNIFREVTSREGLINNEPFAELKDFFYLILRRLERYVVDGLKWDSIPEDVQKNLNNRNITFDDELFQLSQFDKDANALDAIQSIIKTQGKDIVSLNINSDIILTLAEEQKQKFDSFYYELEKVGVSKFDKSVKDSINNIRELIAKKDEEIRNLKSQSVLVNTEDLFSREEEDKDDQEVVALQHHINQSTERVKHYISQLRQSISKNATKDILLGHLDRISFENQKVSTLSKFVTKAKFNLVTSIVNYDLVKFIKEYLTNVYQLYDHKILNNELVNVVILMKREIEFKLDFRPIDFVIILDNLLDNAHKAGADVVEVLIDSPSRNYLELKFKDNGNGLNNSISNAQDIFQFGYTTHKNGTGIGLYHVQSILKRMKGTITFVPAKPKGLEFIITIEK